MTEYRFSPIGFIHSCFKEKFGIPRQAGLVPEARAVLRLPKTQEMEAAVRGLEGFSHIWVLFIFHQLARAEWKPLVRPPRLGGAKKIGVLASRSPHRPNSIGLSAVALERVDLNASEGIELHLKGVDLLDGTPVVDIKPYIAYADSIPQARMGWADSALPRMKVGFSAQALAVCEEFRHRYPNLRLLIEQMLEQDPRPAFQVDGGEKPAAYAARLLEFDVHWETGPGFDESACLVKEILKI